MNKDDPRLDTRILDLLASKEFTQYASWYLSNGGLHIRTRNALLQWNLDEKMEPSNKTLRDLVWNSSGKDFEKFYNTGRKTIEAIADFLHYQGYVGSADWWRLNWKEPRGK